MGSALGPKSVLNLNYVKNALWNPVRNRTRSLVTLQGYTGTGYSLGNEYWTWPYYGFRNEWCTDRLHKGPPFNEGGPLDLQTATRKYRPSMVLVDGFNGRKFIGNMIPSVPTFITPEQLVAAYTAPIGGIVLGKPSDSLMDPLGSTGWARFTPGKPDANAGQFFRELDRLPSLDLFIYAGKAVFGKKRDLLKILNAGNRYLDVEFGWKPFVADLKEMYKVSKTISERLDQLRRDNGRRVRRSGVIRTQHFQDQWYSPWTPSLKLSPPIWGECYGYPGSDVFTTQDISERVWFSGGFRYWIPDLGSSRWTERATRALFGVNPTPALLWEVLPWSWLIDWFSNVGDVLQNLSQGAVDDLVADYAFVMRQVIVKRSDTHWAWLKNGWQTAAQGRIHWAHQDYELIWKARRASSPYNFGVTRADLSMSQEMILAALGISRLF